MYFIFWTLCSFFGTAVVVSYMRGEIEGGQIRKRVNTKEVEEASGRKETEVFLSFLLFLRSFAFLLVRIIRPSQFTTHVQFHHHNVTEAMQRPKDKKQ